MQFDPNKIVGLPDDVREMMIAAEEGKTEGSAPLNEVPPNLLTPPATFPSQFPSPPAGPPIELRLPTDGTVTSDDVNAMIVNVVNCVAGANNAQLLVSALGELNVLADRLYWQERSAESKENLRKNNF